MRKIIQTAIRILLCFWDQTKNMLRMLFGAVLFLAAIQLTQYWYESPIERIASLVVAFVIVLIVLYQATRVKYGEDDE